MKMLVRLVWLVTVLGAALLAYVVADHVGGRLAGIAAVVVLLVAPLLVGVGLEHLAQRLGRELHAERVAAYVLPMLAGGCVALSFTSLRATTMAALARVPERFPWTAALLGRDAGRLERALEVPTPSSSARATTTAPPIAPVEPTTERDDGAITFPIDAGAYREEPGCESLADVAQVEGAYQPGKRKAAAKALATMRYAAGVPFIEAQTDAQLDTWFIGAPDSFEGVASRFEAAVHEGSHIWGVKRFSPSRQTYPVSPALTITTRRLHNFPRSEILSLHVDRAADRYAETYLTGASGAQGFNSLLDEFNVYAHSLAARHCTRDLMLPGSRVGARDGILTFMYYVETYLQLGRTRHDADYRAILADEGHRQLIVSVWDRAELWLGRSAAHAELGIDDQQIAGWVYERSRLAEIDLVRQREALERVPHAKD